MCSRKLLPHVHAQGTKYLVVLLLTQKVIIRVIELVCYS
jgi:hypothetical protein